MSKKKRTIIIISIGVVIAIAVIVFCLSVSNLSSFFTSSDNMVIQVFEETEQGTVEKQKTDLQSDSQGYQDIKEQIEAHIYFLALRQPVGYPEFGGFRKWIYLTTGSADMSAWQQLMIANDGTILFTDAAGGNKSAAVLSGTSGKELYQVIAQIIGY